MRSNVQSLGRCLVRISPTGEIRERRDVMGCALDAVGSALSRSRLGLTALDRRLRGARSSGGKNLRELPIGHRLASVGLLQGMPFSPSNLVGPPLPES